MKPHIDTLDLALISRLREVVGGQPATESELRTLADQAGGWERAVEAQLRAAEKRLTGLNADPAGSLAPIADELRRVEDLADELEEVRTLLAGLERRTRELQTEYLKGHAQSTPALSPKRGRM